MTGLEPESLGKAWFHGRAPGTTSGDAMLALCRTFPSLEAFADGGGWDADRLLAYARGLSSGGREAAAFVLTVWNPSTKWRLRFDLHHALANWDAEHHAAFVAWARAPWWP